MYVVYKIIMMFVSLDRRHEKVSTNRGMSLIFAASEPLRSLSEPLGSLANLLKMIEITS